MYRGVLNRDPSTAEVQTYVNQLNGGKTFATVVSEVFALPEFQALVATICGSNPDYGFGAGAVPTLTPAKVGYQGSEAGLQDLLANAKSGSTVCLAEKAMISISSSLHVPPAITLATCGPDGTVATAPGPHQYALMARLVRASDYSDSLVQVDGGGTLSHVWLDGQRNNLGYNGASINLTTIPGVGTTITSNKIAETSGGSSFGSNGGIGGTQACNGEAVTHNLITAYTSVHGFDTPADGMTMRCENLDIENNDIVDVSDVAILLLGSVITTQSSQVINNRIVSAGNSMTAAISTDEITSNVIPTPSQHTCYEGTLFENNTFWTGPYTTFDFGMEAGSREFFSPTSCPDRDIDASCADGLGPIYKNNTTGILSARVRAGIAIAGMLDVTFSNDSAHPTSFEPVTFSFNIGYGLPTVPAGNCPSGDVIAEQSVGHASGTYPTPNVDESFDFCTVHIKADPTTPSCPAASPSP